MARKRIELASGADELIWAEHARGSSAEAIAKALGGGVSGQTIRRRIRELQGKQNAGVAPPPMSAAPHTGASNEELPEAETVPEDAHLEKLDHWIAVAKKRATAAEQTGDIDTLTKMVRLAGTLLEQRRKALPPPRRDPDLAPDMIAAAKRAREALHRLIDSATDPS
jgi:hypothetical protein